MPAGARCWQADVGRVTAPARGFVGKKEIPLIVHPETGDFRMSTG